MLYLHQNGWQVPDTKKVGVAHFSPTAVLLPPYSGQILAWIILNGKAIIWKIL